jgi:hypothetical protein
MVLIMKKNGNDMEDFKMKTKIFFSLFVVLALFACSNDDIQETSPSDPQPSAITFDLMPIHPDEGASDITRAVKQGWVSGDVIFVFFNNIAAPKYLKMYYDGSTWTTTEMNGDTQESLGLSNGATGTMRAVYLPFGCNAKVSKSGTSFVFDKTYYTFYLTATLDYKVEDNKVSGAFNMTIPADYVQFFIEEASAVDEAYSLGTDAVAPVGIASISDDGTVVETTDKTAADDMPGYAYSGGFLFSGKLVGGYGSNHYFALIKNSDHTRHDYFVTGKTLASHSAVKLPANGNSKWQPVGSGQYFEMKKGDTSLGKWYTGNFYDNGTTATSCLNPEDAGTKLTHASAIARTDFTLPSKDQYDALIANCSWTWLSIHGVYGMVVKSDTGFLFFPSSDNNRCDYWASTPSSYSGYSYTLYVKHDSDICRTEYDRDDNENFVRYLKKE